MAEPKAPVSGHDKLMIGQSARGIYLAHAILILGLVIVAFPIYYTFVASTQTLRQCRLARQRRHQGSARELTRLKRPVPRSLISIGSLLHRASWPVEIQRAFEARGGA